MDKLETTALHGRKKSGKKKERQIDRIPIEYHSRSTNVSGWFCVQMKPNEKLHTKERDGIMYGILGAILFDMMTLDVLEDSPMDLLPKSIRSRVDSAVFEYAA